MFRPTQVHARIRTGDAVKPLARIWPGKDREDQPDPIGQTRCPGPAVSGEERQAGLQHFRLAVSVRRTHTNRLLSALAAIIQASAEDPIMTLDSLVPCHPASALLLHHL